MKRKDIEKRFGSGLHDKEDSANWDSSIVI